ncbi:hypothetical protein WME73_08445 [Sorangium sp. So ce302]|uniref:hypothetical protein n=1 Tax=Sorangium sp. So ce302 TaxID=3133297 RepID=UPI003F5E9E53
MTGQARHLGRIALAQQDRARFLEAPDHGGVLCRNEKQRRGLVGERCDDHLGDDLVHDTIARPEAVNVASVAQGSLALESHCVLSVLVRLHPTFSLADGRSGRLQRKG